jgi:hypothetical protein
VLGIESVDSSDVILQHGGYEVEVKNTRARDRVLLKQIIELIVDGRRWIDFMDMPRSNLRANAKGTFTTLSTVTERFSGFMVFIFLLISIDQDIGIQKRQIM